MLDEKSGKQFQMQAEMLANRVLKRYRHLQKRFARENIEIFRLYDWDIPEIRAAVDWYAGHLVIAEYTRKQSKPEWLPMMGEAVANALKVPHENIHLKERRIGSQEGVRYERIAYTDQKIIMSERDLRFYINLYDYLDTGLFSDHRNTRKMIRDLSANKDVLNLYCYTGSFSCYAAKGGARKTVSVDRSETAISWARENMALNGISGETNILVQASVFNFLKTAKRENRKFDLAVVDPPSFSKTRVTGDDFDIVRDHPRLLQGVADLMKQGSLIFFSTNHQDFSPVMDAIGFAEVKEITSETIPEDYISKRKTIHRCWKIRV
ncbi:MAG: methyltransferase domain-containing protein [Desulfobacteraceae bacterium]|nr:MAG: methyltransferase domain-containing protein [Desulfobacteraceae bacterium]